MTDDLSYLAKSIIETNQYLTLSTCNEEGEPWVSPEQNLCYVSDYPFQSLDE